MSNQPFPQHTFQAGEIIFSKGDPAEKLFLISTGMIEIFDPENDGCIALMGPGDAFGEQSILAGGVRNASARALKPSTCMEVTVHKLRSMLQHEPGVLRPTVQALLLQLTLHNEIKATRAEQGEACFEVSERFHSFANQTGGDTGAQEPQLSKSELIQLGNTLKSAKSNMLVEGGQSINDLYGQLIQQKKEELILAKQKHDGSQAEKHKPRIARHQLTAFLDSPEAKSLSTKDSLYLKLLDNKELSVMTAFTPGQVILSPGDFPMNGYLITSGYASFNNPKTGYDQLGPGSVIGLAEGLADQPSESQAIALSPVVALTIPIMRSLKAVRSTNPGLLGIARFTTMRILELDVPPKILTKS